MRTNPKTRTPNPVRTIAPPVTPAPVVHKFNAADALTLKFTLDEARAFRTAIGTIEVLYDALHNDIGHVLEQESYAIGANRIEAMFQLLDGVTTVLHEYGNWASDAIELYRSESFYQHAEASGEVKA